MSTTEINGKWTALPRCFYGTFTLNRSLQSFTNTFTILVQCLAQRHNCGLGRRGIRTTNPLGTERPTFVQTYIHNGVCVCVYNCLSYTHTHIHIYHTCPDNRLTCTLLMSCLLYNLSMQTDLWPGNTLDLLLCAACSPFILIKTTRCHTHITFLTAVAKCSSVRPEGNHQTSLQTARLHD